MQTSDHPTSFGVHKPVGHVVISFPSAEQAEEARRALLDSGLDSGLDPDGIRPYTDREMLAQIDEDMVRASSLAAIGQELNLIKAQRALAERGYHWLVVRARDDAEAGRIADIAKSCGAERAQQYGRFLITELITHASHLEQVAESPDRGLNSQTPSGNEGERALIRPPRT
ncbi:hypothetical protein SNE35_17575 [Paucibacter sp. R3-3]|uniref:Uncharacterized protein n=1 Tax=Roseateles agri TaxID=3098619 RepID=A0ABU5DKR5_9BURK|nr:hypothetical protein [Paucibacter sp. R3-3]MDY0746326.1 hypothetical protein [Paucibacter sp. R3-3]